MQEESFKEHFYHAVLGAEGSWGHWHGGTDAGEEGRITNSLAVAVVRAVDN